MGSKANEVEGSMFVRNVGIYLQVHTLLLPTRPTLTFYKSLNHFPIMDFGRYTTQDHYAQQFIINFMQKSS
jgi:hypothetical protein